MQTTTASKCFLSVISCVTITVMYSYARWRKEQKQNKQTVTRDAFSCFPVTFYNPTVPLGFESYDFNNP